MMYLCQCKGKDTSFDIYLDPLDYHELIPIHRFIQGSAHDFLTLHMTFNIFIIVLSKVIQKRLRNYHQCIDRFQKRGLSGDRNDLFIIARLNSPVSLIPFVCFNLQKHWVIVTTLLKLCLKYFQYQAGETDLIQRTDTMKNTY